MPKFSTKSNQPNFQHGCERAHEVPPLAEELLAIHGFWGEDIIFVRDFAHEQVLSSNRESYIPAHRPKWNPWVKKKKSTRSWEGKVGKDKQKAESKERGVDLIKMHCMNV